MIHDLTNAGPVTATADVVVIGAGTIGLPVSVMLARRPGLKVICLESGDRHQDSETHPLNEVVHRANEYRGASLGRHRCFGGTSTRWGGALIPFQAADYANNRWPVSAADLEPYVKQVEDLFGLEPGPYSDERFPFPLGHTHVNRLAKWPEFKKRNVATLVGDEAKQATNLDVWLNATVTQIDAAGAGQGVRLVARSLSGSELRISSRRVIIAAGAIETTRLALLIDRQNGGVIRSVSPCLGRYFTDHIGMAVADVVPLKLNSLNKLVGWRFGRKGSMRNIRFELAPETPHRQSLPPSFAHLSPKAAESSGFVALREVYRSLQRHRLPPRQVIKGVAMNLPWITRAAWWRYLHGRLLFPDSTPLTAVVVQEQVPTWENHIALSEDRVDLFGVPMAEITWQPAAADIDNVIRAAELFAETWRTTDFQRLGTWQPRSSERIRNGVLESGGVYHPTGSTRMAIVPSEGVVDGEMRVFALPQIQLLSTSVLPTGGGANPTMMALMLAMRCVDRFAKTNCR